MCTTFLTYKLVDSLQRTNKVRLIDYPNLIRLNPSIPWKTRGNGALVIRLETNLDQGALFAISRSFVRKYATSVRANAGLIVLEGETIPQEIKEFSKLALYSVQSLRKAKSIIENRDLLSYSLRNGQGLVGALAGIGNELRGDHTFELIAYRRNCKLSRNVDERKVRAMDVETRPSTFNCYDYKNDRMLICPHGPDPVLLGIRGESPRSVRRAFGMVLPLDNLLGFMIFRTNQGTGEHLQNFIDLGKVKAYSCGKVRGQVCSTPRIVRGGHVYMSLETDSGLIDCAAYEPTGEFRKSILSLICGDIVELAGSVRPASRIHSRILNLEYAIPIKLAMIKGARGEVQRRSLIQGKICLPELKAHRHLTKPLQRYKLERKEGSIRDPEKFIEILA